MPGHSPHDGQPRQRKEKRIKNWILTFFFFSIDKGSVFSVHWSDSVLGSSRMEISLIFNNSDNINSINGILSQYIEGWSSQSTL